jgi:nickel/cobalt exporter
MRPLVRVVLCAAAAGTAVLGVAAPAQAHPLGNFSVNQLGALSLYPDRVELRAVVDLAELPTRQEKSTVESAGPSYPDSACAAIAAGYSGSVGGTRLSWTVRRSSFAYAPGATDSLPTSRLVCELAAPARLDRLTTVAIENSNYADRVGWRELTATGYGVQPRGAAPPPQSASDELRAYPEDLLLSPLDVRSARFDTAPGADTRAGAPATRLPAATTGWIGHAEARLRGLVGDHLTVWVGLLAVLLAIVLGAAHAALPGHGKTVMAMYLAGRAGRPRDALVVGATVTLTHTGGVIAVGLLLTGAASIAGERVLGWLGLASGALVTVVGASMLWSALRRRQHGHDHVHHDHDHGHSHSDVHHDHSHGHDHGPSRRAGRLSLAGIGIAGGLVPSPSALVVLLGAIGLGRTMFGLLLVLAYGVGMAGTLTLAGLLLLRLRDRFGARLAARFSRAPGRAALARRIVATLPSATAGAVLLLGAGIAVRAVAGVFG